MIQAETDSKPSRRDPARHKQELIEATLDLIAEIGIPETTVSQIIEKAGLSRGMIHLHFGGKDQLLIAAAQSFSADYTDTMERLVAEADPSPVGTVKAIIRADLSEDLMNVRAARLWHAFRGIPNPHPEIARSCGTRGGLAREKLGEAFAELSEDQGATDAHRLARDATFGTMALMEGMYVDFLSNQEKFSRDAAYRIVLRFVEGLFPGRF